MQNKPCRKRSYKDITVSYHAMARAEERLHLVGTKNIKRLAQAAKEHGIKLNTLHENNYKQLGLTTKEYLKLTHRYKKHVNNDAFYFYKGNVFIFSGKKSRLLKTIVDVW